MAASENHIAHPQPGVRCRGAVLLPLQAKVERARQPATAEHPFGGDGLRQACESQRHVAGDCLHGPGNAQSELALRVADVDWALRHRAAKVGGDPAKGHDPDQKPGPAKQGKRFD